MCCTDGKSFPRTDYLKHLRIGPLHLVILLRVHEATPSLASRHPSVVRFVLQSNVTSLIVVLDAPQRSRKDRFGWNKGFKRYFCCGQLSILKHGSKLQADVRRLFPNQHRGTTHTSTRGKCAIHSLHLAACNERNADLPGK